MNSPDAVFTCRILNIFRPDPHPQGMEELSTPLFYVTSHVQSKNVWYIGFPMPLIRDTDGGGARKMDVLPIFSSNYVMKLIIVTVKSVDWSRTKINKWYIVIFQIDSDTGETIVNKAFKLWSRDGRKLKVDICSCEVVPVADKAVT